MTVVGHDDVVTLDLDPAFGRIRVVGVLDQLRQGDVRLAHESLPQLAQQGGIGAKPCRPEALGDPACAAYCLAVIQCGDLTCHGVATLVGLNR